MAESDPTTNQGEPEEDQASLSTEDQIGVAPANNNFSMTDLTRPLQKPLKGQEKPVEQIAKKDIPRVAGTNMASGMPAGGSAVSRAAQAGLGLKNAFQAGFRSNRNPEPERDQGANQKQTKDKKTSDLKIAKDATKAAAQAATGNYVGAVLNGLKSAYALTKKHPKEIALGCALPIAIVVVIPVAIFILGLLNMMPGSKSGTTFSQSQVSYNSLNQIRLAAEGGQRTEALVKQIQEGNSQKLVQDLQSLAKDAEAAGSFKEEELGRLKSLVNASIQGLTELASLAAPTDPTEPSSDFYKKVETVAENIGQIIKIYEKVTLGDANNVGFYKLPNNSPYYIAKQPNSDNDRQWGQKNLIIMITNVGKEFHEKYPDYKIRITDLSLANAGNMDDHLSHKCGNDADITVAWVRDKPNLTNGPVPADGALIIGSKKFNAEMAKYLADLFFNNGAAIVAFQYTGQYGDGGKRVFTQWENHKNHIHVRIPNLTNTYPDCVNRQI